MFSMLNGPLEDSEYEEEPLTLNKESDVFNSDDDSDDDNAISKFNSKMKLSQSQVQQELSAEKASSHQPQDSILATIEATPNPDNIFNKHPVP